jgi:hypothetical protein
MACKLNPMFVLLQVLIKNKEVSDLVHISQVSEFSLVQEVWEVILEIFLQSFSLLRTRNGALIIL